jgi:hypothetical protein
MNGSLQAAHGDRTCLLILGMHRSGTSAITRVLNLMGAELPKQMVGAKLGNESGHWEPEQLVLLHDQMLTEAGSSWRDLRPLDLAQLSGDRLAHYKSTIQSIIREEFGSANVFVLKDPRICRFIDVYKTVLSELGVRMQPIIIIRNPLEVSASLSARDNISSAHGLLLWLRHCLDVEKHTRDMSRVFVSYDCVVNHTQNVIAYLLESLGKYLPISPNSSDTNSRVFQFIRRDLRHQAISPADMDHNLLTKTWINEAYRALNALLIGGDDNVAITTLDRISIEFSNVTSFLAQLADDGDSLRVKEQQLQDNSRVLQKSVEQLRQRMQQDSEQRIHDLQRNAEQHAQDLQRNAEQHAQDLQRNTEQHTQDLRRITEQYARELAELRRIDYDKRLPPELRGLRQWLSNRTRKRRRLVQDYHKIAASPLFDRDWYLQNNPDVAAANVNPALHYLQRGGREGRAPGPHFNAYMKANPDVAAAGANPLLHFLETYRSVDDT